MRTYPALYKLAEAYGVEFAQSAYSIIRSLPRAPWGIAKKYDPYSVGVQRFPDIRVQSYEGLGSCIAESTIEEMAARLEPVGITFDRSSFDTVNARDKQEFDVLLKSGYEGYVGFYSSRPGKEARLWDDGFFRSFRISAMQLLEIMHHNKYLVTPLLPYLDDEKRLPALTPEEAANDLTTFYNIYVTGGGSGYDPRELFVRVSRHWEPDTSSVDEPHRLFLRGR